jgi:YaiO family outer membrane protein
MTFISAAILGVALLAPPQAPDQRAEAERLARSGAHAQALKQFQTLAAANPDDIEARLWIARLHMWMGHPGRAADVYESIVATQPQNVDALIGLGESLTVGRRFREAGDALNRAEALAADRPAMLVAQGRLHRDAGHSTLALAYFSRALALEPGDAGARAQYDALRAERAHRIEATYDFEHFNTPDPDTHAGAVEVNGRVNDAVRLFGAGQHVRKFDRDENRGGGGFEWLAHGNLHVRGGGLFGSDTQVLPDADTWLEAERRSGHVSWLGGIRYLHFSSSSTLIWSPGLAVAVNDRLAVTLRYYRSHSEFEGASDNGNDGVRVGVAARAGRRLWVSAGYAHGFEGLTLITVERALQFGAENLTAGFRFDATPFTSIGAGYTHQWRAGDLRVATAVVNLIQRF